MILSDFYAYIVWELIVDLFIPQIKQTQIPRIEQINITVRLANLRSFAGEGCWSITGTTLCVPGPALKHCCHVSFGIYFALAWIVYSIWRVPFL